MTSRTLGAVLGAASAVVFCFVACSKNEPEGSGGDPRDCSLIANACHPYDDGSNFAHECHETGHDRVSAERCTAMKADCLHACPPLEAGAGGSTGSGGAAGAAGEGGEPSAGSGGSGGAGASGGGGGSAGSTADPDAGGGDPDAGETACEQLGRICHGIGLGFTEECHEIGHDGDEAACQPVLAECLAACVDGGT